MTLKHRKKLSAVYKKQAVTEMVANESGSFQISYLFLKMKILFMKNAQPCLAI